MAFPTTKSEVNSDTLTGLAPGFFSGLELPTRFCREKIEFRDRSGKRTDRGTLFFFCSLQPTPISAIGPLSGPIADLGSRRDRRDRRDRREQPGAGWGVFALRS